MGSEQGVEHEVEIIYRSLPDPSSGHDENKAKLAKKILLFFVLTFHKHDYAKARKLLSDKYTQHNPLIPDGPDAVFDFAEGQRKKSQSTSPPKYIYRRVLVDGDFVSVHRHIVRSEDDRGIQLFDMFRVDSAGLIREHWDSLIRDVPLPENARNENGLF